MTTLTSNQLLQNFIAQFFIEGLSAEEAEEKDWNGSEFDFQRNKRLTAISSQVQKVVDFFKATSIEQEENIAPILQMVEKNYVLNEQQTKKLKNRMFMDDDAIDAIFHKTEVVQKDVYDYKTETTTRENRTVEAGIVQKGFCVGFTKVDQQNAQCGVFCDHKNVYAFRRFNGTGAIVEAYRMGF